MARLRSRGARSLTFLPPMIMSPDVMSSSPTIIRSSVDFPQPDGPTRIMNSPSATSMLTSLTAGKPSPYFLTMFFISMAAMGSTLHCAGGQAGDDLALEKQDEDDNRNRGNHGTRGQQGCRPVERIGADEERQGGGDRSRILGGCQGDAEDEVVPREEERQDRGGEHPRCGQRDDDLAE